VTVSNEEVAVEFGDGSRSVLRISSAPVRAGSEPDSPMIGAVAISVDITGERVQAEERLQVGGVERGVRGSMPCHRLALFPRSSCLLSEPRRPPTGTKASLSPI